MALALAAASTLVRKDSNPYEPDEECRTFQRDLFAPFQVEFDDDLLKASRNIGFPELAQGVLGAADRTVENPELLVLAYGLPDLYPLRTISAYLNYLLGGQSRSFAVSDQGLRSPFTALRIADAYARSGRCATAALFVCEQGSLPYQDAFVRDHVLMDSSVLLYFDEQGSYELCRTAAAPPGEPLTGLLAGLTADLDPGRSLLVAGPWPEPDPLFRAGLPVHRSDPGTYCTSVWLDLARHHETWADLYHTLVLCDSDPRTGWSQAAVLRQRNPRKVA
jgi:hypothetical protein